MADIPRCLPTELRNSPFEQPYFVLLILEYLPGYSKLLLAILLGTWVDSALYVSTWDMKLIKLTRVVCYRIEPITTESFLPGSRCLLYPDLIKPGTIPSNVPNSRPRSKAPSISKAPSPKNSQNPS